METVTTKLELTDDEAALLHLLLARDLEASRVELHHTAGQAYREYIKGRMERGQTLLQKMEDSLLPRKASAD